MPFLGSCSRAAGASTTRNLGSTRFAARRGWLNAVVAVVAVALVTRLASAHPACFTEFYGLTQDRGASTTSTIVVNWEASTNGAGCSGNQIEANINAVPATTDLNHATRSHTFSSLLAGTEYLISIVTTDSANFMLQDTFRTACGPGKSWSAQAGCLPCSEGFWSAYTDVRDSNCLACPPNMTTQDTGATASTECECPPGRTGSQCFTCNVGWYKPQWGSGACTECDSTLTTVGPGKTSNGDCMCEPGHYYDTQCEECPLGHYQSGFLRVAACTECPTGSTTYTTGHDALSDCECVPGYYRPDDDCVQCPRGTWKDTSGDCGSGAPCTCDACPAGFTTPNGAVATSAADCTECLPGYYGPSCTACPDCGAGECSDGITGTGVCTCPGTGYSAPACSVCENHGWYGPDCDQQVFCNRDHGTPSWGEGGTGACLSCDTPYVLGAADDCNTCAPRHHADNTAQTCLGCDPGWEADAGDACTACPQGQAKAGTAVNEKCRACSPGSYSQGTGNPTCTPCPPGRYQPAGGTAGCLACPAGQTTDAGAVQESDCRPCAIGTFSVDGACHACPGNMTTGQTGGTNVTACGCTAGYGTTEAHPTTCLPCPRGTSNPLFVHAACPVCPVGTLYDRPFLECKPCPFGGFCAGADTGVVADNGFHPIPGAPAGFYEPCTPAAVCVRGGGCRRGHRGPRCSLCAAGYVKNPQTLLCQACPANIGLIFLALGVLAAAGCVVLVKLARKYTNVFVSLAVAFNFVQIVAVLSGMRIRFPGWVHDFLNILSAANLDMQLFKPECLASDSSKAYETVWLVKLLVPWIILSLLWGGIGLLYVYAWVSRTVVFQRRLSCLPVWTHRRVKPYMYTTINASVMSLFLLFLTASNTALEIFPCDKQSDGRYTMIREPSIRCYEGDWWRLFAGSLVTLLFFTLGMPVTVGLMLHRRRHNLWKSKNVNRFGLLFMRYAPGEHLGELWVLLRKFGVVFAKVVFSWSVVGRALMALAVVAAALGQQLWRKPYATQRMNMLESLMLALAGLVLALAVVFAGANDNMNNAGDTTFGLLLVTVCCVALLILIFAIGLEIRQTMRLKRRGLQGTHATDRLDVWAPFFDHGLSVTGHTQSEQGGESRVLISMTSEDNLRVLAQLQLEMTFDSNEPGEEVAYTPVAQAVSSSGGFSHSIEMIAPRPGWYSVTVVVVAEGASAKRAPSAWSRWWAWLRRTFGERSGVTSSLAPELVRAIMVDHGEQAIAFRVTASSEWDAQSGLGGEIGFEEERIFDDLTCLPDDADTDISLVPI